MGCETDNQYCNCLYYSANALARIITKMAEEEFAVVQLAPSYAFLLMAINNKPGIQPMELSKIMMLTPSTVTRLIEKMEFKGYVERKTHGKYTEVHPTKKSLDINKEIKSAWQNLLIHYERMLGKIESKKLTSEIFEAAVKLQE
jgi:MarR family transcriptional regulator, organic hydroperoxide resistance regulator